MKKAKFLLSTIALLLPAFVSAYGMSSSNVTNDSTSTQQNTTHQDTDSMQLKKTIAISGITATQRQLDEITQPMIAALDKDVSLTETQRTQVKKKAEEYAQKLVNARAMSDKAASYNYMQSVASEYEQSIQQILSPEQRTKKGNRLKTRLADFEKSTKNN